MKLETKHLVGYLPYDLKMYWEDDQKRPQEPWKLKYESVEFVLNNQNKPILRPLSDLTKEIEVNGEKFIPLDYISTSIKDIKQNDRYLFKGLYYNLSYWKIERLLEMHFDIYGLIENNLAIDINTLK